MVQRRGSECGGIEPQIPRRVRYGSVAHNVRPQGRDIGVQRRRVGHPWTERETALHNGHPAERPPSQYVLRRSAGVRPKPFAWSEWQFVNMAQREYARPVLIRQATVHSPVPRIADDVIGTGVDELRPGVAGDEREAAAHSLLHVDLEAVVVAVPSIAAR